jgi:hypothetical protein
MRDTTTVQVSVQAQRTTARFVINPDDPTELRRFAQYVLLQVMRGEVVTVEAVDDPPRTQSARGEQEWRLSSREAPVS